MAKQTKPSTGLERARKNRSRRRTHLLRTNLGPLNGPEVQQPDTSDTLSSHAGNPQQFDWLLRRILDPTAQKMRLGGGYDWKAEMED
ncbi:hypothetical protein Tco_0706433 [Tanacetum coccineum]|uniref:Uncharacterized protein n=1 Tax=Tanacetum coccineum TaxID=301880 RepID=A0ABQ4Y8B8_9ASTR